MDRLLRRFFDIRPQLITFPMVGLIYLSGMGLQSLTKGLRESLNADMATLIQAGCFIAPTAIFLWIYTYLFHKWPVFQKRYRERAKEKDYSKKYWK